MNKTSLSQMAERFGKPLFWVVLIPLASCALRSPPGSLSTEYAMPLPVPGTVMRRFMPAPAMSFHACGTFNVPKVCRSKNFTAFSSTCEGIQPASTYVRADGTFQNRCCAASNAHEFTTP